MIDENIVYVKIKNGIFKCYKSEQMHKPIYYPVESKTNGYIDYNDVIRILNIDDLYEQVKKQKEAIDKATNELFILKDMIYKPETREENFEIQRKISSIIKRLNGKRWNK